MIRHLCRLAWNRKRGYFLLGLEMLISFLIIVVIVTMALNYLTVFYQPLGFGYRDVWWVELRPKNLAGGFPQRSAANVVTVREVMRIIEGFEEVEVVALCPPPFSSSGGSQDGEYDGVRDNFRYCRVTDRLDKVLKLNLVAGRWFGEEDDALAWEPVVVTRKLARTFFGDGDPLGKTIAASELALRVVGVVDHYRYEGPLAHEELFLYRRLRWDRGASEQSLPTSFLIRLQPGTPRRFEKRMRKALLPVARSWNLEVETLESRRGRSLGERIKFLRLGGRIAGFMLAMVGLGLVGVLWQNVTQRTREIGVRRASGATRGQVCAQFVGEVMVVATFAAVLGGMLIVQFAFFDLFPSVAPEVYTAGLLCAAGILYLLVSVAALYPGWLATRVQPAAALHRE